jgi:regulator of replication initiation timing
MFNHTINCYDVVLFFYRVVLNKLKRKYEVAMKEKMLMRLERDRMKARVSTLEAAIKQMKEVKEGGTNHEKQTQSFYK